GLPCPVGRRRLRYLPCNQEMSRCASLDAACGLAQSEKANHVCDVLDPGSTGWWAGAARWRALRWAVANPAADPALLFPNDPAHAQAGERPPDHDQRPEEE